MREKKGIVLEHIGEGAEKVDQFLNGVLSNKFQGLKTALLHIKSVPNLEDPVESLVLFNQSLLSEDMTRPKNLLKHRQLIPTLIGTFMLSIDLDYAIDLWFLVKLREVRSVDVSALF